jgi:hypothetical protein
MSQGKHISPIVRQIVAATVAENPQASREALIPVIRGRVQAAGKTQPATTTLLKLISRYKNRPTSDLDEPWSLASLRENDLPAECLPALTQIWRLTLSLDQPLTIRQAYWAARLHALFPNPLYLWMWAFAAAMGERISELVGEPLDTTVLDMVAARCSGWEQRTYRLTGTQVSQATSHVPPLSYVSPDGTASLEEFVVNGVIHQAADDDAAYFRYEFTRLVEQLPTLDSIGLTFQAQMVYLRWFTFLVSGPKWSSLTPEQAVDVVVALRQWVLQQQTRLLAAQDALSHSDIPGVREVSDQSPDSIASEYPQDLLDLVGFPADYPTLHSGYSIFSNRAHPYLDPE